MIPDVCEITIINDNKGLIAIVRDIKFSVEPSCDVNKIFTFREFDLRLASVGEESFAKLRVLES